MNYRKLSRRDFLKSLAVGSLGAAGVHLVAACVPAPPLLIPLPLLTLPAKRNQPQRRQLNKLPYGFRSRPILGRALCRP
jgi:poly-beta-hydroxyalkanoate depolymerase